MSWQAGRPLGTLSCLISLSILMSCSTEESSLPPVRDSPVTAIALQDQQSASTPPILSPPTVSTTRKVTLTPVATFPVDRSGLDLPPATPIKGPGPFARALAGGVLYEDARPGAECHTITEVNSWHGEIAGVDTFLCAGRIKSVRPLGGILTVRTQITAPPDAEWPYTSSVYYPPPEWGSIAIVNIVGTQIFFKSASGPEVVFDLATKVWSSVDTRLD